MMHPSLHQLLLVLLLKFATGQQPYYSNNGQPLSPSASPYGVNSYPSPIPGRGPSQLPLQPQHHQQPQPYGLNSPQQQQNYHTSQSSQHYAYAPAPSQSQGQGQSKSQLPYGYATQSQPQQHSQPQLHQYGNTHVQPSPQPQYASQQYPSPNTPIMSKNPPTPFVQSQPQPQALPQQHQPQQIFTNPQGQSQFSNRQLATFPQGPTPFRPNQNMAMNAPPATSFSHTGPTPAGGIMPSQFSSRRGPFDGMISRVKEWMPNRNKNSGKPPYSAGMGEMHRLPKPPKYPLYDMPSLGMATPPPPPLMSPMAQMPTNMYSSFAHPPTSSHVPQRGGRPSAPPSSSLGSSDGRAPPRRQKNGGGGLGLGKKSRRRNRPAPPPSTSSKFRSNKRGQRPRGKASASNTRNTYAPKAVHDGYDHPMASNVAPVNSPPLGRPLGFDEYMKRPSHSFTDDPWNFDPNAQSYNEGMNTHAMKYNYDPLGMNTLDTSLQTHLDINKMSYPGDIMNMESIKETPKPLSSQLGGWDLPASTYRNQNQNQQSSHNSYSNRDNAGGNNNGGFSRFDDQHEGGSSLSSGITFEDISPSASTKNSFNQYDPVTEASVVKAETLNPLDVLSSMGGGIEFDLDSLKSSSNNNNNNNNNNDNLNSNGDYADYKLSDHYSASSDHYSSSSNHDGGNMDQDSYSNDGDSYSNSGNSYGSSSNSNRNNRPQSYSQDYDQYSNGYNSYSTVNDYGTRQVRANRVKSSSPSQRQLQQRQHYSPNNYKSSSSSSISHKRSNSPVSSSSSSSSPSSSSSLAQEGMGLFHDFIKDPNPTMSKSRARHSLYKALLS